MPDSIFGKPAGHSITMIELHLLDCSAGQWGYKTIPEKAGPFYYGCPLEFLDLAHDETNQEWRDRLTTPSLTAPTTSLEGLPQGRSSSTTRSTP